MTLQAMVVPIKNLKSKTPIMVKIVLSRLLPKNLINGKKLKKKKPRVTQKNR